VGTFQIPKSRLVSSHDPARCKVSTPTFLKRNKPTFPRVLITKTNLTGSMIHAESTNTTRGNVGQTQNTNPTCIFCKINSNQLPSSRVYEDDVCCIIMDIHPIRPGHALIITRQHYNSIIDMPEETAMHMMRLASNLSKGLTTPPQDGSTTNDFQKCHGTNLLWNNGSVAWQTVPHAHLHVIPRQEGGGLRFVLGICRFILSLMGLVRPTNRQCLDKHASSLHHRLVKQVKSS